MSTNQSNNLRPCPFCGKEPAIDNNFAICVNDDCEQSDYWTGPEVDTWNTRPIEDALESRISELKAKIDNWQDCYCEFETIAPDGNLKISVLDLYNRLTECEARVAELEVENEKLKATQKWVSVEDELPKEDYVESGATYDLVVQYVDQPAFVIVANYYNKLWCDACTDDWVWIPNEFAKFWRERPLPPC